MTGRAKDWCVYNFAVLRAVPHVYTGAYAPVGVVAHASTHAFLEIRVVTDVPTLAKLAPGADAELLSRYLKSYEAICAGDPTAGPVALGSPSDRFHWLTAPRSDVIQSGPVHEGLCLRLDDVLAELFARYVEPSLHT